MSERSEKRPCRPPAETIDLTNEVEVRDWASRLCVTPNELRQIVEEIWDRSARAATAIGVPVAGRHRNEPAAT